MNAKNASGGGIRSEPEAYKVLRGILPFWDLSSNPRDNSDFLKKLGKADHIRGGAIVELDKDSARNTIADGLQNKKSGTPSIWQLDPDSFMLRLFPQNKSRYRGVWSVRLSVDHTAPDSEQGNRGTMVIDQNKAQQWAWLGDLLRVTEVNGGASLKDKELMCTEAGYLGILYEKQVTIANPVRGALAVDFARNKGFITDSAKVGQLSHVLCFQEPPTPTPSGGGKRDTRAADRPISVPRPTESSELLLRGDAGIRFGSTIARFRPNDAPNGIIDAKDGEVRLVELHFDVKGAKDDNFDTAEDPKSNHKKIPKDVEKSVIKGHVRIPKGGGCCHHYDYSYHSPPPWDPGSGSSSSGGGSSGYSPTSTGGGAKLPSSAGRNPSGNSTAPAPYGIGEPTPTVDPLHETVQAQHGFR